MAKAPRPGTKPGGAEPEGEITIVVDGTKYPFRPNEVDAKFAGEFRRACGLSLAGVIKAMKTDPDIDVIAALVWLSRRQHGEPGITYDEVATAIGYDVDIDLVEHIDPADEDERSPEA